MAQAVTREYLTLSGNVETAATPGPIVFACMAPHDPAVEMHILTKLEADAKERAFKVYLTDQLVPDKAKYICSVRQEHDAIVYHVFEVSDVPMRELELDPR